MDARIDCNLLTPFPPTKTGFFPTGLVEPKCWYLKNGGVGWKHGGASLQVVHHNLTWHLLFPNNIGVVWEVEGNGEARVFSIADVAGYNSRYNSIIIAHCCSCSTPF